MKRVVPEAKTNFRGRKRTAWSRPPARGATACVATPVAEFGNTELGLVYVEFDVPQGTAGALRAFTAK